MRNSAIKKILDNDRKLFGSSTVVAALPVQVLPSDAQEEVDRAAAALLAASADQDLQVAPVDDTNDTAS